MPINAIDNLNAAPLTTTKNPSQEAMRRAAQQFEAIMLQQLTSAMNSTGDINDGDEDSLFGGDGGSDLAKKMFSEQMATTISESGGIGLADLIMQRFGATESKTGAGKMKSLADVISAVKEVKAAVEAQNSAVENNPALATRPRIVPDYALSPADSRKNNLSVSTTGRVQFQMPVYGVIKSDFGIRFHPIDKKMKFHSGIDIAVKKGTPIGAAADGVVKFAGWRGGYGYAVIIEHPDGTETLYGHNEKLLVKEGQTVQAGEAISLSGSTGKSTGPHLHFEVRENGHAVNPHKFLSNVLP